MRANLNRVMEAFIKGQHRDGDSKRTCSTDGTTVYSYDMPIAQRRKNGVYEVISDGPTATTRSQISGVKGYLIEVRQPYTTVKCLTGHKPHVFRDRAGRDGHLGRSSGNRSGLKVVR